MRMAPKSEFLRKFENRLSVVGRDGSVNKVGEPAGAGAGSSASPALAPPEKDGISMAVVISV